MNLAAAEISPQRVARLAGALYLIVILVGAFSAALFRDRLFVAGDAAATVGNVIQAEGAWRFSVALELLMLACGVVLSFCLFILFRRASPNLALLALLFNVVSLTIEVSSKLPLLNALDALTRPASLAAFSLPQRAALLDSAMRANRHGITVTLIFFGCVCVLWGVIIIRSGGLPRLIGWLMALAGVCYLIHSFTSLVAPGLADGPFALILLPVILGEGALCLRLLLKGVEVPALLYT